LTYTSAQPGSAQPGPAPQPADGRVARGPGRALPRRRPNRGRFPAPARAAARAGARGRCQVRRGGGLSASPSRWPPYASGPSYCCLRIPRIPAWDSLYAEDQGVYLFDALGRTRGTCSCPTAATRSFVPRLAGQLISYLPLTDRRGGPFALTGGRHRRAVRPVHLPRHGRVDPVPLAAGRWSARAPDNCCRWHRSRPADQHTVGSPWYALTRAGSSVSCGGRRNWGRDDGPQRSSRSPPPPRRSSSSSTRRWCSSAWVAPLPRWREHAVTAGWAGGPAGAGGNGTGELRPSTPSA